MPGKSDVVGPRAKEAVSKGVGPIARKAGKLMGKVGGNWAGKAKAAEMSNRAKYFTTMEAKAMMGRRPSTKGLRKK